MTRSTWAQWGDINAFFGLILDNVAVMIALVVLLTSGAPGFSREFVLTQMIPGTALGVVLGDLAYTWMAVRLARRTGRPDVTAMPLGLDTPSTFVVGPLVLLPALGQGMTRYGLSHEQAMVFAWHVGAVLLVLVGIFKSLLAPLGGQVRRWVPRAGLLGSLAGVALALIAFLPLWTHVAAVPVVGLVSLTVILVALVARRKLPFRVPGALAAVILGMAVWSAGGYLGGKLGIAVVPPSAATAVSAWRAPDLLPECARNWLWWQHVLRHALASLPILLPFALATIVGGIDCTESAAAAGDTYDTRTILLTEGLATVAAGACGGVIQNTPYIGQPAYKAMGGRAAYTLATAVFIGAAGGLGWFTHLFQWLPEAATFPLLIFIGLEITAQAFRATPERHFPAVALAMLPTLAYMALVPMEQALAGRAPDAGAAVVVQSLRCLASGFIVSGLLWASALAAMLDEKLVRAAAYLGVAGACSLLGIIHSPLEPALIALPATVVARMAPAAAIRCQSPFHWAAAYGLAAAVLLLLALWRK
ncbi:MAG: permease [Thermoguttaceae bacterium]|jgi:AGZA family xanthine/uracil permease-like MFS transporter